MRESLKKSRKNNYVLHEIHALVLCTNSSGMRQLKEDGVRQLKGGGWLEIGVWMPRKTG